MAPSPGSAGPARDPLNTSFTWRDSAPPYRALTEAQARAFDADGYVVLEGALSDDTVDAMVAAIDPAERAEEDALAAAGGRRLIARAGEITFTTHLAARSPVLAGVVAGPPFAGLCADLVGPDAALYWDQAVYKKPGTRAPFPWHQDNGYAYVEPQQYLTCWVALTDATEENGCPWVVPGLHRLGTLAHRPSDIGYVCLTDPPDARPAPVGRGGIVVFSSLTPHCTGPNRTDAVRKAYIAQFAPAGHRVVRRGS